MRHSCHRDVPESSLCAGFRRDHAGAEVDFVYLSVRRGFLWPTRLCTIRDYGPSGGLRNMTRLYTIPPLNSSGSCVTVPNVHEMNVPRRVGIRLSPTSGQFVATKTPARSISVFRPRSQCRGCTHYSSKKKG
jgi:hypothetical protein